MGMSDLFRKISAVADSSTLLTALTSAFTLTPESSLFFAPLTLPFVLHKSEDVDGVSDHPTSSMHLKKKALLMALGSTLGSLFKTWGILPSIVENVGSQAIISTCSAGYIALIVWIHRKVVKVFGAEDDWTSSWLFGLIWAGMWLVWTKLSPLGRHVSFIFPHPWIELTCRESRRRKSSMSINISCDTSDPPASTFSSA